MALNGPSNTQTFTGAQAASVTPKRKGSARKTSGAAKTPAARKSAGPVEILFKELPNPYRQPEPPYLWIDYPQQNERLLGSEYVIRMGVGGAETVELSFDKGPWAACRFASGYWWFDWKDIAPGKHQLVARMRATDGRWFKTPARNCDYRL